ncbi:MAG: spermidine synthase [Planctomycetota bacterium]
MPGSELNADVWISEYITPWDVYLHGVTKILAAADTEWQAMQIVETGAYGKGLVLDGKWQSCTGDEFLYHEPLVHPACLSFTEITGRPPRTLLILGGGEGATLREALRWPSIERAAMVDIDGTVVDECTKHLPEMHRGAFDDPRADVVIGDALAYVADPATKPHDGWDVIVSDLSDPIEDGPSYQLFTKEYFQSLKAILSDGGVLAVQSGPVNPPELKLHARLRTTLDALFAKTASLVSCVPTYPSPWSFILAGNEQLTDLTDAERIDALLAEHVRPFGGTELRMFDGVACRGLYSTPKHLREAIESETVVYTKDNPPKFFGTGNVS